MKESLWVTEVVSYSWGLQYR